MTEATTTLTCAERAYEAKEGHEYNPFKSHLLTKAHLEGFKLSVRGRRGRTPRELQTDDDWWALGQHHGLATPLLDWTTSPFVAAFFAFLKEDKGGGEDYTTYRSVFALHSHAASDAAKRKAKDETERRRQRAEDIKTGKVSPGILEHASGGAYREAEPELRFVRPLTDENERLVNQGGLFTRLSSTAGDISLEDWIVKHGKDDADGIDLIKFLIPNSEREQCLISLNRMNINHLTLFPDLGGASAHCNLALEIDSY